MTFQTDVFAIFWVFVARTIHSLLLVVRKDQYNIRWLAERSGRRRSGENKSDRNTHHEIISGNGVSPDCVLKNGHPASRSR
jgi:hypothetical protein